MKELITVKNALLGTIGFVCNGCHGFPMLGPNISDITIITVRNVDYRFIIRKISQSEAINLLKNDVLKIRGYTHKKFLS